MELTIAISETTTSTAQPEKRLDLPTKSPAPAEPFVLVVEEAPTVSLPFSDLTDTELRAEFSDTVFLSGLPFFDHHRDKMNRVWRETQAKLRHVQPLLTSYMKAQVALPGADEGWAREICPELATAADRLTKGPADLADPKAWATHAEEVKQFIANIHAAFAAETEENAPVDSGGHTPPTSHSSHSSATTPLAAAARRHPGTSINAGGGYGTVSEAGGSDGGDDPFLGNADREPGTTPPKKGCQAALDRSPRAKLYLALFLKVMVGVIGWTAVYEQVCTSQTCRSADMRGIDFFVKNLWIGLGDAAGVILGGLIADALITSERETWKTNWKQKALDYAKLGSVSLLSGGLWLGLSQIIPDEWINTPILGMVYTALWGYFYDNAIGLFVGAAEAAFQQPCGLLGGRLIKDNAIGEIFMNGFVCAAVGVLALGLADLCVPGWSGRIPPEAAPKDRAPLVPA